VPCNVDGDCTDDNPCTTDTCGDDKTCAFVAIDKKPAPDAAQTPGDCKTIQCVAGKPHDDPQNDDVPNDKKDCTIDSCSMGMPSHVPKMVGTPCDDGMGNSGRCTAQGECPILCKVASDCKTMNPCVTPACDTAQGTCVFPALPDGMDTPGVPQVDGDCHRHICLAGADVDQVDDSDVPVTGNDCDLEVCNNGAQSNPPKPGNLPCNTYLVSQPGFCNDTGACSECKDDSDCAGKFPSDDCRHPACQGFACVEFHDPMGKATTGSPAQVLGDCQKIVCNGTGGTMVVPDTTDPASDNNTCTTDVCGAGTMTDHNAVTNGITCGLNNSLSCLAGVCQGCTVANQATQCPQASCVDANTVQLAQVCNGGGGCVNQTPSTQDCSPFLCAGGACTNKCNQDSDCSQTGAGNYCTGPNGTCAARLPQGAACAAGHPFECQSNACVDGVCCNNACGGLCQACSAAKKGSGADGLCGAIKAGSDPDSECADQGTASCGTNGSCDGGGACQLYSNATVCVGASCADMGTLNKQHLCNGSGVCVTPTPPTQGCTPYLCASNACGMSCINDGQCAAGSWCSGGACIAKLAQGSLCGGTNQCQSGFCVDGYCCDTGCGSACQACAAAKKQNNLANGTCGQATDAQNDPRGLCSPQAASTCQTDGKCSGGACEKWVSGTVCVNASCSSGSQTTQGTCNGTGTCGGSATTACSPYVCNGTTSCFGACTTSAQCAAGNFCSGNVCIGKLGTGAMCAAGGDCTSGFCTDGVCCTTQCNGACQACSATLKASGTDGTCGPVVDGTADAACPTTGQATCLTDGKCSGGSCEDWGSSTACSATISCVGASLTTAATCSGSGACTGSQMSATCGNGLNCNSGGTACRMTCSQNSHCQSGYSCQASACKLNDGGACSTNAQCLNNKCGTAGSGTHCCAAATTCVSAGVCGTSDCNASGACAYPAPGTPCGASCAGNMLTPSACNGSGACATGTAAACTGGYMCADATSCLTACGNNNPSGDMNCAGTFYCDGSGAGACQPKKAATLACTRDAECTGGTCTGAPSGTCN
jgi:hypothetical protein